MKKFFLCFGLILLTCSLISCREKKNSSSENKKITVVATIFPAYDWARNLSAGSDNINVELLLKDGVDLHSYQPSTKDIVKISTADIFIYVGGESDTWVKDALKNATKKDMLVINLMEVLKGFIKTEELVEGMEHSHEHAHGEEHSHEEGEEHNHEDEHHHEEEEHQLEKEGLRMPQLASHSHDEVEYDEHVWLSLNNAIAASNEIAKALMEKDEANSQIYMANLASYVQALSSLKEAYADQFNGKTIIVCDRFPFRYLTDEFGIKYYAAFTGCSAESEASFETIAFLTEKTNELQVPSVFVTESADKKIATTVISGSKNKECKIITLDSMQSVTWKEAQKGADYLEIMRANFEALK